MHCYLPYETPVTTESLLASRLIYGSYPEVLTIHDNSEKVEYLTDLINSYLLKDILVLDKIKNSAKLVNILRLLAFQVGHPTIISGALTISRKSTGSKSATGDCLPSR